MITHTFTADSGWTIRDNVTSKFVAIITFREFVHMEGIGTKLTAVECKVIESDVQSDCINAALEACKADDRNATFCVFQTWLIPDGLPHAGKRDNMRIN